jgi:hypothetical protein
MFITFKLPMFIKNIYKRALNKFYHVKHDYSQNFLKDNYHPR